MPAHKIKNGFEYSISSPSGSMRTSSTSKIKNRIVIIKNRNEKGVRAFLWGSNPHSNGVSFSRETRIVLPIKVDSITSVKEMMIEIIRTVVIIIIVNSLINRWKYTKIVRLRLQNVNTR